MLQPPSAAPSAPPAATNTPAPQPIQRQESVLGGSATTGQPATSGQTVTPVTNSGSGSPGMGYFLPMMIIVMVVMLLITSMSGRKEKKKRAEMMASIARNDRVSTIGGIIGTVTDLTDDEVTLRVDDTSNTRIRFSRAAIQSVLRKNGSGGGAPVAEAKPLATANV